jgi:pimeloyl-ACP methyl ester carboxylesterase
VYYTDSGPEGQADTFVLIHGIGVSGRYFGPLKEILAKQARVICADLPGFGRSAHPHSTLTMQDYADEIIKLCGELGIRDPLFVGHSMGCQVAMEVLVRAPDLSRRAVLVGPTVNSRNHSAVSHFTRLLADAPHEPFRVVRIAAGDYLKCGPLRYLRTLRPMLRHRIETDMKVTGARVTIVRGMHDPIVRHDWAVRATGMVTDSELYEIAGAGHGVHFSHPEEVARICLGLLRK